MLSSYGKRRSTPRGSSATAASSVNSSPPFSPQFGGNEDGGTGGGGTGEPNECATDGAVVPSNKSTRSSSGATPFDERVKSVRSRIREMVAVAGEDSSDGSEVFDINTASSKRTRGSKASRPRHSGSSAASSTIHQVAAADAPSTQLASERKPSQSKALSSESTCNEESLGRAVVGSSSASSSPRTQGPAGRVSAAVAAHQRSISPSVVHGASDLQVVGRDSAAYIGARVRILDPQLAKYVEATGSIVEVRCNGERVRVEHDGDEKAQRYYNTGKSGEYQLSFETAAGPATSTSTTRHGSRLESRRLPEAPPIVADSSSSSGSDSPGPPTIAAKPSRPSKAVAKKKGAARTLSRVSQRSFSEPPEIAPDTQPDIAEPKVAMKKSRYSQLRQSRQSAGNISAATGKAAAGGLSVTAQAAPTAPAAPAAPAVLSAPAAPAAATQSERGADASAPGTEPEGKAKLSYSQRRSMRMSQMQGPSTASTKVVEPPAASAKAKASDQRVDDKVVVDGSSSSSIQTLNTPEQGGQFEELKREHEALLSRLRSLEQQFVRDLGAVKDDVHLQIETAEKRIYTRVLEEVDTRIRQTVSGKIAGFDGAKPYGHKLSLDVGSSSEPTPKCLGTPVNEEPEQEYDTCDVSDYSSIQASGSRRGSNAWMSPSIVVDVSSPQNPSPDVSLAELADNRRRLQNIGNVARSITSSIGGKTEEPSHHPAQAKLAYEGLQTPDFASVSFADSPLQMAVSASTPAKNRASSDDGLDAEMARLADLRRFASNVLKAAESQCQQPSQAAPAHGGRMSTNSFGMDGHPSALRDAASHQDCQDLPRGRRSLSVSGHVPPPCPWEDDHRCLTPRGRELPAQPPPQPPPTQVATGPGRVRRSSAQPLHVPWPAAGSKSEFDGEVNNQGRLVF